MPSDEMLGAILGAVAMITVSRFPRHSIRVQHGFTLIELMITIVIVGVLTAIAYPSYTEYVQRSRRAEAAGSMLENAQFMERIFTQNQTYVLPSGVTLPIASTPRDTLPIRYDITLVSTATTYTLTATAAASYPDDRCGALSVDQLGNKTVASGDLNYCWAR
jgi:type IV pilus assembly protein PilE